MEVMVVSMNEPYRNHQSPQQWQSVVLRRPPRTNPRNSVYPTRQSDRVDEYGARRRRKSWRIHGGGGNGSLTIYIYIQVQVRMTHPTNLVVVRHQKDTHTPHLLDLGAEGTSTGTRLSLDEYRIYWCIRRLVCARVNDQHSEALYLPVFIYIYIYKIYISPLPPNAEHIHPDDGGRMGTTPHHTTTP